MRAVLTLQVPTDDWKRGRIIAATTDGGLIRAFCRRLLQIREADADNRGDVFDREIARLELEQLRARLSFALEEEAPHE